MIRIFEFVSFLAVGRSRFCSQSLRLSALPDYDSRGFFETFNPCVEATSLSREGLPCLKRKQATFDEQVQLLQ